MKKISILLILFLFTLYSCGQNQLVPVRGPEGDPGEELNFSEFNDFPIPINSKLIKDQSIIIAKKNGWLGRLAFTTSESQITVYDFFQKRVAKIWLEKNIRNKFR